MNSYERYNLDKSEIVWVEELPKKPKKYVYILEKEEGLKKDTKQKNDIFDSSEYELFSNKPVSYTFINENGRLRLASRYATEDFAILLLFLKKYREHPQELLKILDNFDDDEKEVQLKRMQLMLTPMKTLEDFRNVLRKATQELPLHQELSYFGDGLMFLEKEEDLGNITNVFGEISPFAEKFLKKYNHKRWERGVIYNEEKNIYELWYVKERSNDWHVIEKFYDKQFLFEYLLNQKIQAIIYQW